MPGRLEFLDRIVDLLAPLGGMQVDEDVGELSGALLEAPRSLEAQLPMSLHRDLQVLVGSNDSLERMSNSLKLVCHATSRSRRTPSIDIVAGAAAPLRGRPPGIGRDEPRDSATRGQSTGMDNKCQGVWTFCVEVQFKGISRERQGVRQGRSGYHSVSRTEGAPPPQSGQSDLPEFAPRPQRRAIPFWGRVAPTQVVRSELDGSPRCTRETHRTECPSGMVGAP